MTKLFLYTTLLLMLAFISCTTVANAQQKKDTVIKTGPVQKAIIPDSVSRKKADSLKAVHSPRKAIMLSAIFPGLGQIYNKKYWKLPIVYGGIGASAYVFFDNIQTYKDLRLAYKIKYNITFNKDSTGYEKVKPQYLRLSQESLRQNRDQFRRYVDYSALVFVFLWGLNVVDAAVDAHLKSFDVSPDLTLRLKAGFSEMANKNGVSLVLTFK